MSLHRQGLLILGNPKYPLLSFAQSVAKDKQKAKKEKNPGELYSTLDMIC